MVAKPLLKPLLKLPPVNCDPKTLGNVDPAWKKPVGRVKVPPVPDVGVTPRKLLSGVVKFWKDVVNAFWNPVLNASEVNGVVPPVPVPVGNTPEKPLKKLVLGRPVAYYYSNNCPHGGTTCSAEVVLLGTPVLWWAFLPALVVTLWWAIAKRDLSLWATISSSSARVSRSAASRSATGTQPLASRVSPADSGRCRSTIEMRRLTRT